MSLDVANKNNIELQKTIKKQSLHLTVNFYFVHTYILKERPLQIFLHIVPFIKILFWL